MAQGHTAGIQPQQSVQGLTPFKSIPCLLHSSHAVESLKMSGQKRVQHSLWEKLEEARTPTGRGRCYATEVDHRQEVTFWAGR